MIDRRTFVGAGVATAAGALWFTPAQTLAQQSNFVVTHTPGEWLSLLGPARYAVLRDGRTENPYSSPLERQFHKGTFCCAGCELPLFSSRAKFDSGTGWPSFSKALPGAVLTRSDWSHAMDRIEVLCARCGGHLGHLFDDGPKPGGLRYCINGLALDFHAEA